MFHWNFEEQLEHRFNRRNVWIFVPEYQIVLLLTFQRSLNATAHAQLQMGGGTFCYPVEESAIITGVKETAVG